MKQILQRLLTALLSGAIVAGSVGSLLAVGDLRAAAAGGDMTDLSDLGDWYHYNGLIFGDMTSYTADAEGAVAIGGTYAHMGISGGYDVGGSYYFEDHTQLGEYTNPHGYPTLLLGTEEIQVGNQSSGGGHFNVFGGPIVMSPELRVKHDAGKHKLVPYDGKVQFIDADKELIDEWFAWQYRVVTSASTQYLAANDVSVDYADFSSGAYITNPGPEYFVNTRLTYNGAVDQKVLSVTVRSDATLDSAKLPISAKWVQEYDLVIFNFPDAVNVTLSGDPQTVRDGLSYNKTWPDGHLTAAQQAERFALCNNTVYNFPNAKQINLTNGVFLMGSLLAPQANVSASGGSINGQLTCMDFTTQNSMELHALRLTRKAYDLVEEPEDGTGSVELTKYLFYQAESQVPLEDAVFQLYCFDDEEDDFVLYSDVRYTTDESGGLRIEDLPLGRYRLVETAAPPGFDLSATGSGGALEFTLTSDHEEQALQLVLYNEPMYTDLHLVKVEQGDHGTTLPGARFQLTRLPDRFDLGNDKALVRYATSDVSGSFSFSGLPMGSYVLRETTVPDGYERMQDWYIDIIYDEKRDSLIVVDADTREELSVTEREPLPVENAPGVPGTILDLFKYDDAAGAVETAKGLAGARFQLYQKNGDSYELYLDESKQPLVLETDLTGHAAVQDLPEGSYRLVEITTPDGYGMANTLRDDQTAPNSYAADFNAASGQVEIRVNVPNTALVTGLTLVKRGQDKSLLGGATFALYRLDQAGQDAARVLEGATAADGTLELSGLTEGRYRLTEVKAPTGYKPLEEDIFLTVSFEESTGAAQVAVEFAGESGLVLWEEADGTLTVLNDAWTGSLTIYKQDRDTFQNGTDWQENITWSITYLEGATFQLQRRENGFSGAYVDYGEPFTTTFSGYGTDASGNQMAGAHIDGLIFGDYHVVEVAYPAGYVSNMQDDIMVTFSITEAMAQAEAHVELTVSNRKDTPRSRIKVCKVDRNRPDLGLEGVEFKLWLIDDSLFPLSGREHLDEVMPWLSKYGQQKYAFEKPLLTDSDGYLTLDLEPGLYVLFEYEPHPDYLYTLERGQTLERATDPSFYDYTYLFRVVSMPDPADGVRIQWVDRYKLLDGEVIRFNVDAHDRDNSDWNPADFTEEEYRAFTITNRRLEDVVATVQLLKTDEENEPLQGAVFTLKRAEIKDEESPTYNDEDYSETVGTFTSGAEGLVTMPKLSEGMYRLEETTAPGGYQLLEEPVYFSLVVNGYSKHLDFYDGEGTRTAAYDEPVIASDGSASGTAVFTVLFHLDALANRPVDITPGQITILKVDAEDDTPLPRAQFTLYVWDEKEQSWTTLNAGLTTDQDGLLTLEDLPAGEYKLVETAPPVGYLDEQQEILFTMVLDSEQVVPFISGDRWDKEERLVVANKREDEEPDSPMGDVTLLKVDGADNTPLAGAQFTLYAWEEKEESWTSLRTGLTTGQDGLLTIDDLPAGDYRLVETTPPTGYRDSRQELLFTMVLDGEQVVPVTSGGSWNESGQLVVTNDREEEIEIPTGEITLLKVDSEDNTPLSEAQFTLYAWDKELDSWTMLQGSLVTGQDGLLTIGDLPAGGYRLVETAPPAGYRDEQQEMVFTMVQDEDLVFPVISDEHWDEAGRLVVANSRSAETDDPVGEVTLYKVDSADEAPLSGAQFTLYVWQEENGWTMLRSGLTTGGDGLLTIGGLPAGFYRLSETAAPSGYLEEARELQLRMVLDEDVVRPDLTLGEWSGGRLLVRNTRLPDPETPTGEITVEKVDEETGSTLQGAVFDLYRDGETAPMRTGLVTDHDGQMTIAALEAGDYHLVETAAPDGFRLDSTPIPFSMVLRGDAVVMDDETPLEDVTYTLYQWVPAEIQADAAENEAEAEQSGEESQPDETFQEEQTGEESQPDEASGEEQTGQEDQQESEDESSEQQGEEAGGEESEEEATGEEGQDEGNSEDDAQEESQDETGSEEDAASSEGEDPAEGGDDADPGVSILRKGLPVLRLPTRGISFMTEEAASGSWVEVEVLLQTDESGAVLLTDLPAGQYRLQAQQRHDRLLYEQTLELEEDTPQLQVSLLRDGADLPDQLLVVYNTRKPEESGGGSRPGGGGSDGGTDIPDKDRSSSSSEYDPGPPTEGSGSSSTPQGGGGGFDPQNPGTGTVHRRYLIAFAVLLILTSFVYFNRRTLAWWMHRRR